MTRKRKIVHVCLAAVLAAVGLGIVVERRRGIPFVTPSQEWSIGIYDGPSPLRLGPASSVCNPVITKSDVTDIPAGFVADPFMVRDDGAWYMFFEVWNNATEQGDISVALSDDGLAWTYRGVVLDEPFHLSYPHVFRWNSKWYMLPESNEAGALRLYEAVEFPDQWRFVATLLPGRFVDTSIVRHGERWWLFACGNADEFDNLRLFHASDLAGPYEEHPSSPLLTADYSRARPAGRVVAYGGNLLRFAMDTRPAEEGGQSVRAFEITSLTPLAYEERETEGSPILKPSGRGWNDLRMHHVDPHELGPGRWLACVDGSRWILLFGLDL